VSILIFFAELFLLQNAAKSQAQSREKSRTYTFILGNESGGAGQNKIKMQNL